MGQYVQAEELGRYYPAARIIDLADGDVDMETLDTLAPGTRAYLEERIANAEAEAHGYLQGRFSLPIVPVPERLRLAVGKLAIYYLFADKQELGAANPMDDQYEIHREWLEGVKESDMFIGNAQAQLAPGGVMASADEGGLVFGSGGLDAF